MAFVVISGSIGYPVPDSAIYSKGCIVNYASGRLYRRYYSDNNTDRIFGINQTLALNYQHGICYVGPEPLKYDQYSNNDSGDFTTHVLESTINGSTKIKLSEMSEIPVCLNYNQVAISTIELAYGELYSRIFGEEANTIYGGIISSTPNISLYDGITWNSINDSPYNINNGSRTQAVSISSQALFFGAVSLVPSKYPITYYEIHSNLSGPSEAAAGEEVTVDVSFPDGYKLKNATQGSGISVRDQYGYVDFTYDETARQIKFTMPTPE